MPELTLPQILIIVIAIFIISGIVVAQMRIGKTTKRSGEEQPREDVTEPVEAVVEPTVASPGKEQPAPQPVAAAKSGQKPNTVPKGLDLMADDEGL